jgi:tripartite ATP-independent transporter DctM subunit
LEWWLVLTIIFGSFVLLISLGMPVGFAFLIINIVGVFIYWQGFAGIEMLVLSLYSSLSTFTLLPLLLFMLMGEVTFRSGIGFNMIDAAGKWIGRVPGRLALLAVFGGAILSAMSGSSMATTAILGSTLVPEMEKRGYHYSMSMGPILGSGGLAIMIPPSSLAIIVATMSVISIGDFLLAIVVPGIMMAVFYTIYVVSRCIIQPHLAPAYDVDSCTMKEKLKSLLRDILPLGIVIFLVIGVVFFGIATPSEAAATGTLGIFLLAVFQKKFNWSMVTQSISGSIKLSVMILFVIAGSTAFSQILAFSGASQGMIEFAVGLPVPPIIIIAMMLLVSLILGMFMTVVSIMMICLPLFVPVVLDLGYSPLWFGVMFLLGIEMSMTTPPYGNSLFVMRAVGPKEATTGDIWRSGVPFLICDALVLIIILFVPEVVFFLPSISTK